MEHSLHGVKCGGVNAVSAAGHQASESAGECFGKVRSGFVRNVAIAAITSATLHDAQVYQQLRQHAAQEHASVESWDPKTGTRNAASVAPCVVTRTKVEEEHCLSALRDDTAKMHRRRRRFMSTHAGSSSKSRENNNAIITAVVDVLHCHRTTGKRWQLRAQRMQGAVRHKVGEGRAAWWRTRPASGERRRHWMGRA
jgi:hypothetical protein